MKIVFPMPVKQLSDNTVEVQLGGSGQPVMDLAINPKLGISDKVTDKIYSKTLAAVILASIKVKP